MTSASSFLERELLGSARSIIDAHSNTPFAPQTQPNTYRTPYGITTPVTYPTSYPTSYPTTYPISTTTNYTSFGSTQESKDSYESKKALNDVKIISN